MCISNIGTVHTLRQLIVSEPGSVEWGDAPDPGLPSELGALVRPVAVATCDFDHLIVAGLVPTGPATPIGHECVAEVVEVGSAVRSVTVGEVVVVPFQISCGECDRCRGGQTSSCEAVPWLSCFGLGEMSGSWGGAVSDLLAIPYADAMLVPLPPGVDPVHAAAAGCNLVDAYRCVVPQLMARSGGDVLVAGGAFTNIALYAASIARSMGSNVTLVDPTGSAAAAADRIGAGFLEDPAELPTRSYPVTVDASMNPETLRNVIRATADGGEITVSTMYPEPLTGLPMMELFERCATLRTGQPDARAHLPAVLDLLTADQMDDVALTAVLPWDEAGDAFGQGHGKFVVSRERNGAGA